MATKKKEKSIKKVKVEKKAPKKKKKEKKMVFEVDGDNDDLGGDISVDLDEEPKVKSENVFKKNVKSEDDESDDEGEGKVDLDGEIKYLKVKASKSVEKLKKGDKVKVDGLNLEVDSQYVLIDHGKTKEMAIELFDPETDKDYQLRYFSGLVETSMEFYELDEIVYNKKDADKVEW